MDKLFLDAMVGELDRTLAQARVDKAYQYGPYDLALEVYHGQRATLLVSADPQAPRLHLTTREVREERSRSPILEAARARLVGGRIERIDALPNERVARVHVATASAGATLVLEAIPRAAALFLLDAKGTVIAALGAKEGGVRGLHPGSIYEPPHAALATPDEDLERVLREGQADLVGACLHHIPGLSPLVAREIVARAEGDPARVVQVLARLRAEALENPRPAIARGRAKALLLPVVFASLEGASYETYSSLSAAADVYYEETVTRRREQELRARALTALAKKRAKLEDVKRTVAAIAASGAEADRLRVEGEMLLAFQHSLHTASGRVVVPTPDGSGEMELEVDADLSAKDNAVERFARYKRLIKKTRGAAARLANLDQEVAHLLELEAAVESASAGELPDLERELQAERILRRPPAVKTAARGSGQRAKATPSALEPRRFVASSGATILVGRSSRGNDRLTFDLAQPYDFWLHADAPGSHVVLANPERRPEPEAEALEEAAALAAWYSKLRHATRAEVHWTTRRQVQRLPRAPLGLVRLGAHRSFAVSPALARERFALADAP